MAQENLKRMLPQLGFLPIEDEHEYSNGEYTIFINGKSKISIISDMSDEDVNYLSVPTLKVTSRQFLVKVLEAMEVL